MKKAAFLLVVIFTVSSCSLFEKPSMTQEEIDALINQKASVEEELINLKQAHELLKIKATECAQLIEQQAKEKEVSGNYCVIVGSFKSNNYAEEFAAKVKQSGGAGKIIPGPSDFKLVVSSAHPTLKEAVEGMYKARSGGASGEAWVYRLK
jgi:hypothetical protein